MKQDQSVEVSEAVEASVERPLYEALLEGGVSASLAYEATQCVRELAGANTVARVLAAIKVQGAELHARIDAQGAALSARIDAQGAEIKALGAKFEALETKFEAVTGALRWMMGIVIALLAALVVLVTLALQDLSRPLGGGTAALGQPVAAPNGTIMSEPVGADAPDEVASPAP